MSRRSAHLRLLLSRLIAVMILVLASLPMSAISGDETAQYPDTFRRWVHVGTGVILPGTNPLLKSEEGMHHIFANGKASDGYASGDFADGAILVYELREAQQKNGVIFEGERRRVDVMIKDSKKYAATGGWRFERFWAADQTQNAVHDGGASCFECHANARAHGFVFSRLQ
jgi:Cytochrome P460